MAFVKTVLHECKYPVSPPTATSYMAIHMHSSESVADQWGLVTPFPSICCVQPVILCCHGQDGQCMGSGDSNTGPTLQGAYLHSEQLHCHYERRPVCHHWVRRWNCKGVCVCMYVRMCACTRICDTKLSVVFTIYIQRAKAIHQLVQYSSCDLPETVSTVELLYMRSLVIASMLYICTFSVSINVQKLFYTFLRCH